MSKFTTIKDLQEFRKSCTKELCAQEKKILVCAGTGCIAGGSIDIYNKFIELCQARGLNVQVALENHIEHPVGVKKTGCNGFCELGPLVRIEPQGWLYTKVKVADCEEIVDTSILGGQLIERLVYGQNKDYAVQNEIPFYKKQTRIVFENCGHIDSEDIGEYIAKGGYLALEKALSELTSEQIVNEITESGLRGRGGGGFPAGRKWSQVARQNNFPKYVVCNGDEGD
ncbi:MAG: NADH-quinone oxidoreductase subunit F, partial [Clostridia bacterium]|nr:NADH-quinone oxidoreductase subunit F [Clostridia bacterium]